MVYAGLDLHRRYSVITVIDEDGYILRQKRLPNDESIIDFLQSLGEPVQVAVEATRNWYWLYDLLDAHNIEVKLSHPLKTRAIAAARIKTDRLDAHTLAQLLRSRLLPCSYIPDRSTRHQRELLRYRASLVKLQTGIKNRIHTLLAKNNISHRYTDLFGNAGMAFLSQLQLPEPYQDILDSYLNLLAAIRKEIAKADHQIRSLAREDELVRLLTTVLGISYYSALLIRAEIGEINRFPSAKKLAAYAGLIPATYASGGRVYHGHITKQGSRYLRWILIQAVMHIIRRPGLLRQFFRRIARRKGPKVARVAVTRKLLTWIYYMLKERKPFEEIAYEQACRVSPPMNLVRRRPLI